MLAQQTSPAQELARVAQSEDSVRAVQPVVTHVNLTTSVEFNS